MAMMESIVGNGKIDDGVTIQNLFKCHMACKMF